MALVIVFSIVALGFIRYSSSSVFAQIPPALESMAVYLCGLLLLLIPGFALATQLASRRPNVHPTHLVVLIIVVGATLGYLSFWAYFFGRWPGKILFYTVYPLSIGAFLWEARKKALQKTAKVVALPFVYIALAGLFYLSLYSLFRSPLTADAYYADSRFFDTERPGDNLIPYIVAERIYYHQPLQSPIFANWRTSDRPPLQSGIVLLEWPLKLLNSNSLVYQWQSIGLQCLWLAAVWGLLYSLGTSPALFRRALALFLFSGFFFYNSVYTWPKMLAASFILFVVSILINVVRAARPISLFEIALASMSLGLALTAHPGSVFSLCGFFPFTLYFRRLFFVRAVWISVPILAVFVLPWTAYQKFVDPPGNRLAKMHFAGVFDVDSRTFAQALHDAYTHFTPREIANFKGSNIRLLAGQKPLDAFGLNAFESRRGIYLNRAATESSRVAQREWIWNAIGLLNLGWLGVPLLWLKHRRQENLPIPFAGWLLAAALFNLLIWCLLLFGPHATVTTHSSYAEILFLCIGLCGFVFMLPKLVYFALLALQIFNLFVVWVWSPPNGLSAIRPEDTPVLQFPMLIAAVLFGLLLLWLSLPPLPTRCPRPDAEPEVLSRSLEPAA